MDNKRNGRQDAWIVTSLLAFTFLSRIPFRSQILYHWDSVNFAYAMREFSVAKEQPQPPGYIVYVWLARLVDLLFGDAQTTMVAISIIASALAVVALFFLGRAMFSRQVGLAAALFLATSPLFWFYGEIALPHTFDTLLVILSAWWLYEVMRGDQRYLYPAVAVVAVAGGVRQQTLVFLAPLLLFALRRVGLRHFVAAALLGAAVCLAWFLPLMSDSDGLGNYLRITDAFSRRFQETTSVFMGAGWQGITRNVRKLAMYTAYGWSVALLPGLIYGIKWLRAKGWIRRWEQVIFMLLWIGPALMFYVLVHMGQQGLIFIYLPPLLLISAAGVTRLLSKRPHQFSVVSAALLAINTAIFMLAPEYPMGPDSQRLLTRATLVNSDRYFEDRLRAIEEHFAPESTAILAADWHHVEYYLPGYSILPFGLGSKWEVDEGRPVGNPQEVTVTPTQVGVHYDDTGQATIVVFDPKLMEFSENPAFTHQLPLGHGEYLPFFALTAGQAFHYGAGSFGVEQN